MAETVLWCWLIPSLSGESVAPSLGGGVQQSAEGGEKPNYGSASISLYFSTSGGGINLNSARRV